MQTKVKIIRDNSCGKIICWIRLHHVALILPLESVPMLNSLKILITFLKGNNSIVANW